MTIYVTSIPLGVITWNGMEGGTGTKDTIFLLMSKYNVFRVHFGGSGVKLLTMKVKFKSEIKSEADYEL